MAAIDKIYLNYENSKEFIEWVKKNDSKFVEEFKESKCPSMFKFFFFTDADKEFVRCPFPNKEKPICKLPVLVEIWLLRLDIPKTVKEQLCENYGLYNKTIEEVNEFINSPLEKIDTRPKGKHVKIISRYIYFEHRNYGEQLNFELYNSEYYGAKLRKKGLTPTMIINSNNNSYLKELLLDYYWYCKETNSIENFRFPKKKNIFSSISLDLNSYKHTSLKSIINYIRKLEFPIGTVLRIVNEHYAGEVIVKVTK